MSDELEDWSPKKDNLQEEYLKRAMAMMDDFVKRRNEPVPAMPPAVGYVLHDHDIVIKRIENGFMIQYCDSSSHLPVAVYSTGQNIPEAVAVAIDRSAPKGPPGPGCCM